MTTKPEPVGWWCKELNRITTKDPSEWLCEGPHELVYTRTQVRKGFEELVDKLETSLKWPRMASTIEKQDKLVILFSWVAK